MHEAVGSGALLPSLLDKGVVPSRDHCYCSVRGSVDCGNGGCAGL